MWRNWLASLLVLFACNSHPAGIVKIEKPFPIIWVVWPFPW